MKAAVLHEPGMQLRIEDVRLAEPSEGEVLVRVLAAGVCHTDLHYLTGDLTCRLPAVLGHEGAGVVERVGPGKSPVAPGDRVVLMWRPRCGRCEYCAAGRPALCTAARVTRASGGLLDGTSRMSLADGSAVHHFLGVSCFAEYCVVAAESVIAIPASIPGPVAAVTGCAVITGAGAVLNLMGQGAGRGVLVLGAGGVGLSAVMAAAMTGAYPVIAADARDEPLSLARALGATHTVNSATADVVGAVRELLPDGAPWCFEAIGSPATLQAAINCLSPMGTLVAIGLGRAGQSVPVPINELVQKELRVIGSLYGSANTIVQIPQLLALHAAGRLDLARLIGTQYRLEDVNEAYRRLPAESVGRGVIVMEE